jgi:F0F1-type ATP synthase delta subunit
MNESYREFQEILAEMKAIAEKERKIDSEIWNSIFGKIRNHNMY